VKRKNLTWADIYFREVAKGYDYGYAAWVADEWERKRKNK
jgi:hypothetical protein